MMRKAIPATALLFIFAAAPCSPKIQAPFAATISATSPPWCR